MTTYTLARSGDVYLEFDGELLADESSRVDGIIPGNPMRSANPNRWTEIRIYRLDSGKGWVTEVVGKSAYHGEVDRAKVTVCSTPEEVRDSVRHRRGHLINIAVDAMLEASDKDPLLKAITVQRI